MKKLIFSLFVTVALLIGHQSYAQTGVAINTTGADAASSAMLDVSAANKGILVPRMTAMERLGILNPAKGLLVYQNDGTEGFYYFDGTVWTRLANGTYTETDPVVKAINGIVKSNGTAISSATAGTDYITPAGNETLTNKTINGLTPTAAATGFTIAGGTAPKTLTVSDNATVSGTNTGDQTLSGMGGVAANTAITGATNTKITYDSKGLVTAGTAATTADIAASANKNYVTDAQAVVIGNTSGTNTGDDAVNSNYSSLVTNANHSGDAEGATALIVKKINGVALSGLATGILKNTTTTGVPSIAVSADFPTLNQNTTGTASNVTGTVAIANGGTGATTATNAINALLPAQSSNSGKYLSTDGSSTSWTSPASGWSLTGNAFGATTTNFIGTTDNNALVFKVNGNKAGEVSSGTNTSFGYQTLNVNTGLYNTANGYQALYSNAGGYRNTANGSGALYNNTEGDNNTANGYDAGRFITDGSTANATGTKSVYFGALTKSFADAQTNQIVIGYDAIGAGSNTATLGNSFITTTVLRGNVRHYGTTSGYVGLQAPATVSTPYSLTLPITAPASNGQVLSATTAGVMSWVTPATSLAIGNAYGGGIIFWLDASKQHGLIAATTDQSTLIEWYYGNNLTGATLDGVYAGKANTRIIVAFQGAGSYAAKLCDDYAVTVNNEYYDDWYLPSKYELNLLYNQKAIVGGFDPDWYWSSTEANQYFAWGQYFGNGLQDGPYKFKQYHVRAVRAF